MAFNLTLAANNHPVITRNGLNVTLIRFDLKGDNPLCGYIHYSDGDVVGEWDISGNYVLNEHPLDLLMRDINYIIVNKNFIFDDYDTMIAIFKPLPQQPYHQKSVDGKWFCYHDFDVYPEALAKEFMESITAQNNFTLFCI
jgi:hypothetical protein